MKGREHVYFNRVAILGVGLMGASLALTLKAHALAGAVTGYGRSEETLRRARTRGIIDSYVLESGEAVRAADLVILCTPVGTFSRLASELGASLTEGALVTDVGSVKGALVRRLETLMPEGVSYIGSHPIAGSDRSGIDHARADLFEKALCIVTPTDASSVGAFQTIVALWERVGCRVTVMDPERHDAVYGAVSHLPHLAAFALVNTVEDACPGCMQYAGSGFKDMTRIAMSSPGLWSDICLLNSGNLIRLSQELRQRLEDIEGLLASGSDRVLAEVFGRARDTRIGLTDTSAPATASGAGAEGPPDSTTSDQGL